MKTCFVRVIGMLFHFRVEIPVGRRYRAVVADPAIAGKQNFDELLTIDGIFEGQAHIDIVKGGRVREHGHGEVLCSGDGIDGNPGLFFQKVDGAEIDTADAFDFAGNQGRCPGHGVA